jgi:DNA-binding NtrC family response regulator
VSRRRIMIVEDEAVVQLHLRRIVESLDYTVVGVAADADTAVALARAERPDLVLMDIRLRGDADGVDTARRLKDVGDPAVVFLSAYADAETVARTEQVGAMGYIVKPYSSNEVRAVLATALVLREQIRNLQDTRPAAPPATGPAEAGTRFGMLGRSPGMTEVYARIAQVAAIDWPVLVEGETGTGKELTARAIHRASPRSGGPFVAVNCAGLTDTLLTSQLFGHRKGAFTGALDDQPGFFEAAHGGVLFLDEIADVSPAVQKALLRVLEDGMVQRVGDTVSRPVDVRVVSATQRDLADEVAAGRFRADLLFRLRTVRLILPPLRERREDIVVLAEAFLADAARVVSRAAPHLSKSAAVILRAYPWPGNVRELRNAMNHALLEVGGDVVEPGHMPPELLAAPAAGAALQPAGDEQDERRRILDAMARAGGNRKEAAALLGISRATLYRRFEALGIEFD